MYKAAVEYVTPLCRRRETPPRGVDVDLRYNVSDADAAPPGCRKETVAAQPD
ncbi:MAG: hypothetical protein ACO2PN_17305 [Pyrobaculum sp.]|jgi:hypothetical protein